MLAEDSALLKTDQSELAPPPRPSHRRLPSDPSNCFSSQVSSCRATERRFLVSLGEAAACQEPGRDFLLPASCFLLPPAAPHRTRQQQQVDSLKPGVAVERLSGSASIKDATYRFPLTFI